MKAHSVLCIHHIFSIDFNELRKCLTLNGNGKMCFSNQQTRKKEKKLEAKLSMLNVIVVVIIFFFSFRFSLFLSFHSCVRINSLCKNNNTIKSQMRCRRCRPFSLHIFLLKKNTVEQEINPMFFFTFPQTPTTYGARESIDIMKKYQIILERLFWYILDMDRCTYFED